MAFLSISHLLHAMSFSIYHKSRRLQLMQMQFPRGYHSQTLDIAASVLTSWHLSLYCGVTDLICTLTHTQDPVLPQLMSR